MKGTRIAYNFETANDAGLYREFIATHYGDVLTFGGARATYERACRHCRSLAKLIGSTVDNVMATAVEDWDVIA